MGVSMALALALGSACGDSVRDLPLEPAEEQPAEDEDKASTAGAEGAGGTQGAAPGPNGELPGPGTVGSSAGAGGVAHEPPDPSQPADPHQPTDPSQPSDPDPPGPGPLPWSPAP